jgi:thymidylate synthase
MSHPEELILLHYADKVDVHNSRGHIGILTLWSRKDVILKQLEPLPASVAAIANFYGDGISQLLVNLLYNPQIRVLHVVGANRSGSLDDLRAYFNNGIEEVQIGGTIQKRIRGTSRLINVALDGPDMFLGDGPRIIVHDNVADLKATLAADITNLLPVRRPRQCVNLIEPIVDQYPSIQTGHQVVGDDLLDAWRELLFYIVRFGQPVQLTKGARRELYNVKVLVRDSHGLLDDAAYQALSLDKARILQTAHLLLVPVLPDDTAYTYGHRLHRYFGKSAIEVVCARLAADREDRKCYISLWDTAQDLAAPDAPDISAPCWVGAFWRITPPHPLDGSSQLLLSATFRTHRAYTAWVENAHALAYLNAIIADRVGRKLGAKLIPGPLTIYSQSISVDPAQLSMVQGIISSRKWRMRDDGRGQLTFSLDKGKIVVEHKLDGLLLRRYTGTRAEPLAHQLALDAVVSDLGHALYIGRQLGKLEECLKYGLKYEET